jgi:outer membrane protein
MRLHWRFFQAGFLLLIIAAPPSPLFADSYTLEDLCRIALTSSEKLKLAEQNVELAEIGTQKARSYFYPRLTATGGVTQYSERKYTNGGGILQPESASAWGIRMEETLSLGGRELTALDVSRQSVLKNRYDIEAIRDDFLLRNVASVYYDVLLAGRDLEIADANLERLSRYRDAAQKRLRIGEVTKTALLRAEGELSGAKADRLQAQNTLELATAVLASEVGIQPPFTLQPALPEKADISNLADLQKQAFLRRAELKSLKMQKKIAINQTRFAEGSFFPSLTLTAAYAGAAQNPATSSLNPESFYGGLALNFPLFDGGLRKADVSEAKVRERQADLRLEEMKKAIDIELKTAHLDFTTQAGVLRFLEDQLLFARENYHAVSRQFELGLADSLDVMDANTLLVSSERKTAAATYRLQLASLRLKKAAGLPWVLAATGLSAAPAK